MDESLRNIQPTAPGSQPTPGARTGAPSESTEFRRLLEQLESLSRNGPALAPGSGAPTRPSAPGVEASEEDEHGDSPEDLARDLAKADEEFQSVMDLRRRLEDAFRRLEP